MDRNQISKVLLIRKLRKRLNRKQREESIRPLFANRKEQGESILLQELRNDKFYHHKYLRMSRESFDEILNVVRDDITGKNTHSHPISSTERLALTLRYLGSENSQVTTALSYRISPSSVSLILRQVVRAINKHLGPIYLPDPDEETWKSNEKGFRSRWNHPNCIGAMDGKHVRIQCFSGSQNFNYKGYYSMVLLAVVGPTYKFTMVDVGASGSQSDGGVFARSEIYKKLEMNTLLIPEPSQVGNYVLPNVIVADDAFPLKNNVMKPFPGKELTADKRIYNYRLSRARMVVENTFGILAARWRVFHTPIIAEQEFIKEIIYACVILHNFCMDKKDMNSITADKDSGCPSTVTHGNWRTATEKDKGMEELARQGSTNYSANSNQIRCDFMKYFNSEEGSVQWQTSRI